MQLKIGTYSSCTSTPPQADLRSELIERLALCTSSTSSMGPHTPIATPFALWSADVSRTSPSRMRGNIGRPGWTDSLGARDAMYAALLWSLTSNGLLLARE